MMNCAIRFSLSFALLLIATHRLPAPIFEAPETPSPSPTAAPIKETVPQTVRKPEHGSPQGVLQRYFNCFAERDPSAAYNLLSASFRSEMSFKKYSAIFSSTREMKIDETRLVNQTDNIATVFVRFQETDADYHQTHWEGPVEFVREGGEWRIKTLRALKKVDIAAGSAGQSMRQAEKTWDRPHVYLELASESQRKAAVDLKQRLARLGCEVIEIEGVSKNVDIPSTTSELRYFSNGDAAEAQRLAKEIESFFSSTGIIAYLPEGMPHVSHSRQYEVWFSSAFH